MATILEFRSGHTTHRTARARRLPLTSCEIVIFPGVRYEYNVLAIDAAQKSRRKGARKRDKLEIK